MLARKNHQLFWINRGNKKPHEWYKEIDSKKTQRVFLVDSFENPTPPDIKIINMAGELLFTGSIEELFTSFHHKRYISSYPVYISSTGIIYKSPEHIGSNIDWNGDLTFTKAMVSLDSTETYYGFPLLTDRYINRWYKHCGYYRNKHGDIYKINPSESQIPSPDVYDDDFTIPEGFPFDVVKNTIESQILSSELLDDVP
jgi:hypothetical protein